MQLAHLNVLLEIILKNYFFNSRCILILTDRINFIDLKTNTPIIYLKIENNNLNTNLIFQHYGCNGIIINHEKTITIFEQFEKLIRLHNERFNDRKYIVIHSNFSEILTSKPLIHVCNLLLIRKSQRSEEIYELGTHKYVGSNPNEEQILDFWYLQNGTFLQGSDLFPDKLGDQKGRPLRIGTFTYEPYCVVGEGNQTFYGTETSLALEFVKKFNMTPEFTVIGEPLWGDIFDNWTGVGVMGSLLYDEVDIGYSAIYMWEEFYKFLDYSKPLTRTGITCIVPSPGLATGWLTPLYSFSTKMWEGMLLIFVLNTILLSILLYKQNNVLKIVDSLTTVIRMHLLQALPFEMRSKLIKFFVALNLVYILLISSSYSSGLATVMTIPRYQKAIKTVDDLAESGLSWGASTDAWLISLRQVEEEKYQIIKRNFLVKNEEELEDLSWQHNFGYTLERLPHGHYAVGPYIKRDVISNFRIMDEDLYWQYCIFVMRKNSVLLPLLDKMILRVLEAGLDAYWENEVASQFMDMSVQRGIRFHVQEHQVVKIHWTHVEGAFAILLLGSALALICFLIEILMHKIH